MRQGFPSFSGDRGIDRKKKLSPNDERYWKRFNAREKVREGDFIGAVVDFRKAIKPEDNAENIQREFTQLLSIMESVAIKHAGAGGMGVFADFAKIEKQLGLSGIHMSPEELAQAASSKGLKNFEKVLRDSLQNRGKTKKETSGKRGKTAEDLLGEANDFVGRGEYAAAVGRFRQATTQEKNPLENPNDRFLELVRRIESHATKAMPPVGAEDANEFTLEADMRTRGFKNFLDIKKEFGLSGLIMSEEALAKATTPEALSKLEEALRPAGPPQKNV